MGNPGDSFARYGLAMELRGTGDLEAAAREFAELRRSHPDYTAGYYHAGQTLEQLGLIEEARAVYLEGIDVAARQGDQHARRELQAALELL